MAKQKMNLFDGLDLGKMSHDDIYRVLNTDPLETKNIFNAITNWRITPAVKKALKIMHDELNKNAEMDDKERDFHLELTFYVNAVIVLLAHDMCLKTTGKLIDDLSCFHEFDFITVFNFNTREGVFALKEEYDPLIEISLKNPQTIDTSFLGEDDFVCRVVYTPKPVSAGFYNA